MKKHLISVSSLSLVALLALSGCSQNTSAPSAAPMTPPAPSATSAVVPTPKAAIQPVGQPVTVPTQTPTAVTPKTVTPTPVTQKPVVVPTPVVQNMSVSIQGFAFSSSALTVKKGAKVTWTNMDAAPHTVTADNGAFGSATLSQGQSFSFTFNTAGSFSYHCAIHPMMKGVVSVE